MFFTKSSQSMLKKTSLHQNRGTMSYKLLTIENISNKKRQSFDIWLIFYSKYIYYIWLLLYSGVFLLPYLRKALDSVGKKYSLEIVSQLVDQGEGMGFNFLLKSIPSINPKSLSTRLKELEKGGIITKQITMGAPIKISYRLTEKGLALKQGLQNLDNWGKRYCK